jgi:N-acylneuraminate cytidylyltransferase
MILIPARGGSKRIPNKNLVDLNGKPLITYVIDCSLAVSDDVYVSTDCDDIAEVATQAGATVIKRPNHLSGDYSPASDVVAHFLEEVPNVSDFAYVQPTSPLLTPNFLREGFERLKMGGYNSVISVTENKQFFWDENHNSVNFERGKRPRTQDMDKWYAENGAFYLTSSEAFHDTGVLVNGEVSFVVMPQTYSFEVDTYEDLEIVRNML